MSFSGQEPREKRGSNDVGNKSAGSAGRKSQSSTGSARSGLPPTTNLEEMKIDQLYLLEVLVNSIEVQKESSQLKLQNDNEPPPLAVRIKFMDFPCIEINQDDFLSAEKDDVAKEEDMKNLNSKDSDPATSANTNDPGKTQSSASPSKKKSKKTDMGKELQKTDKISSKVSSKLDAGKVKRTAVKPYTSLSTGKSCLFPMSPLELLRQTQRHPLMLHVYRKNAENEIMMIGHCKIRLGTEFEDAIVKAVYDNLPLPVTTTIENECQLNNTLGDETGRISVFIRLSCFGATIITQFQLLGEESEGYIFKTSKNDNTLEAQKNKGSFLFNKSPFKKENVVKSLNIHDISPLKPLIATEETAFAISGEICNPYLTSPLKTIPWRKYVTGCGCENTDDNNSLLDIPVPFGTCGCGYNANIPPYIDQTRICNVPPCPLPDCDCYSTTPNMMHPEQPTPIIQTSQANNAETGCCLGADGTTCSDCPGSSSQNGAQGNCPVEDCDCNHSPPEKEPQPPPPPPPPTPPCPPVRRTNNFNTSCPCSAAKMNQSKNCPSDDCECYNSKERTNFIRKKCPPVSVPYQANSRPRADCDLKLKPQQNSGYPVEDCGCFRNSVGPQNVGNLSSQSGRPQLPENRFQYQTSGAIENCFFSDFQGKQSNCPPNYGQADSLKCKIACSNQNPCFCYGGGTNKPFSDTFGNQYTKINGSASHRKSGDYDTGSRGSGGQNQAIASPTQAEESSPPPPQAIEEDKSQKADETSGGGDTIQKDTAIDTKPPTKEKSEDIIKNESLKKPEEPRDGNREQEKEPPKKNQNNKNCDARKTNGVKQHKKKRKFRSIFQYSAGMYPGNIIGHRHCSKDYRFVPKTMGWLWNIKDLGDNLRPRRGWRPGAMSQTITKMIRDAKLAAGLAVEEETEKEKKPPKSTRRGRRPFTPRSKGASSNPNSNEYSAIPQPPTLHLHKKDGAYFISMNPLKAESEDEEEDRSPLMFKILPHEDEASTTSESSLEIEFTAPGAFRKKPVKPVMETIDTQYSDPESTVEIKVSATRKGKKGTASKKDTESNPPSTMASVAKDNKWDADRPTQVAKTKK